MRSLTEAKNFGAIDADSDQLLTQTFEDHQAFLALREMEKFLIIGKKGSGKTAIFKQIITNTDPEIFTFGHTFSDYPWQHHERQARAGIPDFDKFTHSWKYLIMLTASKMLLNYDEALPFDDESMEASRKLESFVVDTYGSRDPDVTQIFTPSKSLKLKPNIQFDVGLLKGGVSPESVPMEYLPLVVQDVNRNLLDYVLTCLHPNHQYYICFDQLDFGFNPEDASYINRLIGLLLACRDINLAARNAGKRLCVAVFLRDDIYETLRFDDKNKLTENFVSLIEWDTPRTNKSLKDLMEKRFRAVLSEHPREYVKWIHVFNEAQEMPGRQDKYRYILDRTYLRPRDMIKFINAILANYKERTLRGTNTETKFSNLDVQLARQEYSHYLHAELEDEIYKHLPEYKMYLDLLRTIGAWHFETKAFENVVNERPDLSNGETPATILEKLYNHSIIGFFRAGGKGHGGSEYVFRYKETLTKFDSTAVRFRVHLGLVEVLGLKRQLRAYG